MKKETSKTQKTYRKPTIAKKEQSHACAGACGRHWGCGELVRRT